MNLPAAPAIDLRRAGALSIDGEFAAWEETREQRTAPDLRATWSAIYRNRHLILLIVGLALIIGAANVALTGPVYRARASIQIDQQAAKVLGTEDAQPVATGAEADRFLQTQVDLLQSRALAERVATRLRLFDDPRFAADIGAHQPLNMTSRARRSDVIDILQRRLHVDLPRNSRVVVISIDGRDPTLAARIANAYAVNFIATNIERRYAASAYSRGFLEGQLAKARARLEQSERALIDYARGARLIDASAGSVAPGQAEAPRSLVTANLVQLNQAYAEAQAARVQAQQRWETARSTPLMSLPEVLGNSAMQQLLQHRAELRAQYQQLRERLKADHPSVKQADAELAQLDAQTDALANGIRNSLKDQYQVAQRQEASLAGNVSSRKAQTLSEQDRGIRYNILKRDADTNRQLYDALLQRSREVSAEAGISSNNVTMVDAAEPPLRPIAPRPLLNLALALLVGLAVAAIVVSGRERLDDVVRVPEDVEGKLSLPLLGVVPVAGGKASPLSTLEKLRSPLSESYHAVRSALELSSRSGVPPTLLITSSRQGEGKSITAFAIARDFAMTGRRTLLIDADLRKPSLHGLMSATKSNGLSNLLARQLSFLQVVQNTYLPKLDFIPSGTRAPDPAMLLSSPVLDELLATLRARYDVIVIDGPPVLALADSPRLADAAAGTVFVVEANGAHRGSVKGAIRRLLRARAQIIGAVLTKFDTRQIGYKDTYRDYRYGDDEDGKLLDAT